MIYVSEIGTPLGPLGLAECKERFLAVWPGGISDPRFSKLGLQRLGEFVIERGERPLARHFSEFLSGGPRGRVSVDLSLASGPLERNVYRALFRTRAGDSLTLSELAQRSGDGVDARIVEEAVRRNPLIGVVPTHRVAAGGSPVGCPEDQAWARFFLGLPGEARASESY